MKYDCNDNTRKRQAGDTRADMPGQSVTGPVTQISADDVLAEEGPMTPHDSSEAPDMRQIEQEVTKINPSIDSMESRG